MFYFRSHQNSGFLVSLQQFSFCLILILLNLSTVNLKVICRTERPDLDSGEQGTTEWDCDDNDDGIELGTAAIVGLIVAVIAVIIAVPILICFCCGCLCFKPKDEQILVVATPAVQKRNFDNMAAPSAPQAYKLEAESRRNSEIPGPSRARAPTAAQLIEMHNVEGYYYNRGAYEPPPPYIFTEEENEETLDEAWAVKEVNIDEQVEKSRLGPSLIKGKIA